MSPSRVWDVLNSFYLLSLTTVRLINKQAIVVISQDDRKGNTRPVNYTLFSNIIVHVHFQHPPGVFN